MFGGSDSQQPTPPSAPIQSATASTAPEAMVDPRRVSNKQIAGALTDVKPKEEETAKGTSLLGG